ncbi:MAG: helix-turn-helix transcriptional regulator [Coprobacter sp.]|nr:helix-turn-helix transcriptional regulator [Coprobacter sp.]
MVRPIKSIDDILERTDNDNRILRMIRCTKINAAGLHRSFSSDMYIDAATAILVFQGNMQLDINRRSYTAESGTITIVSVSHRFRVIGCSDNFDGLCLLVGEEFMTEMDSVDMIYKRIRYGVKLYDKPVVALSSGETVLIGERLRELQRAIGTPGHLYYREVVLNRLFAFYLDLSDIIDRTAAITGSAEHTARYESIVKRFIELLTTHYRTQHTVGFYAGQLHLSAHYLTLIVKEVTGRTAADFIFGMLYSEARTLLSGSNLSVQEIAARLEFSDQSAFGKFFKRRAGLSPLEYRKKHR